MFVILFSYSVRRSENSILTLMIMLRVKIDVTIYIEPRNGVKFFKKSVLGMRIFTRKLTRPPFRTKKKYSQIQGFGCLKELAWEHGFNEAIGKLIRVQETEKSFEKCQKLAVWFGSAILCTFPRISQPSELGLIYRLLR